MINFENKRLLITGGTGSFGNQVLDGFLNSGISEITIFSRDENKQDAMRSKYKNAKIKYVIGDVRDRRSLKSAMSGVNYVFHAAALKQVPSCEFFPIEAVKTNILGTENVLDTAIECRVENVVCLSTDKAAYPVNAMGISKALMEKVAISKARECQGSETTISITRYGNVLNSRGSVVPLFINKIQQNADLPITHPEMTRFLMTLPEALDLVLFAFKNAKGGEIFIQKAPSCKVKTLALALLKIFDSKSKISEIGIRHGEKMYEVLMTREERSQSVDLGGFFKINPDFRSLNYEKYLSEGSPVITESEEYNSNNTNILDVSQTIQKLLEVKEIADLIK